MTSIPPSLLGRRAALMALGCAVALVILVVGIPLYASYMSQRAEIAESLRQLAVFKAEAGLRPTLEAQLRSLKLRGTSTPGYISANNVALAQAEMERAIKDIAATNNSEVRSTQAGPVDHHGTLDTISVQYDLSVPITHLKPLLYAVETRTPYLYIDQIDIAAPAGWQQVDASQAEPQLEVRWTLHAYRWRSR